MSIAAEPVRRLAVYDGQTRIGQIITRGREGFEADIDDRSRSIFSTVKAAATAISEDRITGSPKR